MEQSRVKSGGAALALPPIIVPATRQGIESLVEALIQTLDTRDGDPDFEEVNLEDSFATTVAGRGPGCEIADGGADPAWAEWHTRGRHKEPAPRLTGRAWDNNEDDEDDDPDHGGDEGEPDFGRAPPGYGAGCIIADPDFCTAGDDRITSGSVTGGGAVFDTGDQIGSDDDAELHGDETDGNWAEDDFQRFVGSGPGCPISDPGGGDVNDEGEREEV